MKPTTMNRTGATFSNVLLIAASLSLLTALIYPRMIDRSFERRVDEVAADVEQLRAAVNALRTETGTWPPTQPVADLLPRLVSGDDEAEGPTATLNLAWRRLESVDIPEPTSELGDSIPEAIDEVGQETPVPAPSFFHRGAISVRTEEEALLGALVRRYRGSFVHDGVWTLVLPRVPVPSGS